MNVSTYFRWRPAFSALPVMSLPGCAAHAQTIGRVGLTDNDLSCQQVVTQQAQQDARLAPQAQRRKEHLTTLFLSKGCKLADVQK